jgi:hypothetical protein
MQSSEHFPLPRVQVPLLEESSVMVDARESLPPTRIISAQMREGMTTRGRATSAAERGRGRGKRARRGRASVIDSTTSQANRGRGKGSKRKQANAREGTTSQPDGGR